MTRSFSRPAWQGILWSIVSSAAIMVAVAFTVGALYIAMSAAAKRYPVTAGQQAYAESFCVSEQHGFLGTAYITKPDMFGSNGSMPRLTIRCTFGKKAYMLKIVDLERVNEIPKAGT
jgi:hypothetical protein